MTLSIPLAGILALATIAQGPPANSKSAAIVPFVGDEVAIAIHVDLTRLDVATLARPLLGRMVDEADLSILTRGVEDWVGALQKAGATDLYLLGDPANLPGYPVIIVPLGNGADGKAIGEILTGSRFKLHWPSSEMIRGAVVADTTEGLARMKSARPSSRPEVVAAFAPAGDSPIQILVIPSTTLRRSFEETMPTLPAAFGNAPISAISKGMSWASIGVATVPKPLVRVVLQAADAASAKALGKIAQDGLDEVVRSGKLDPSLAGIADSVVRVKPEVSGDRVTLEADLDKTTDLVSIPFRQVRDAARKTQCINNLKQFGLAMHNYHAANNHFPAAYVASPDGKPLLSWRVLVLPYIDQKALFDEFHLNEPWDSPHNKALIPRMPKTFACPSASKSVVAEGKTSYLVPRGPDTIFPGAEGVKIQQITDGTSNTIMVVDANDEAAVIWTKPDDWETSPDFRIKNLFGHHVGGTGFLLGDGSVRFLRQTISPNLLKAMISRNGGEVLNEDN